MQQRTPPELRAGASKRVLKGGTIIFDARRATVPCVVRELSDKGARLQAEQISFIPDQFELFIDLDGAETRCKVTWRSVNEIGVEFLSAPVSVAPKRVQVIGAAVQPERPQKVHVPSATIPILIADDDPDDRMMIEEAFRETSFRHPFEFVENGEQLLLYLRAKGRFAKRVLPGLILLDLNMPLMDGRTALMHIKTDPAHKRIPVIVLTTSNSEDDIQRTYDLGVSAFISKPNTQEGLVDLVRMLNDTWLKVVSLPAA